MRKQAMLFVLLGLILSLGLAQADAVYKWVDAQGNVHYSDHPRPGAEKVQLPKTQTYQPPSTDGVPTTAPAPDTSTPALTTGYSQFSISSPTSEENIWYVDQIPVSVSLSPGLRDGDTLTYQLDGQTIGPTNQTTVDFKDVSRGQHTVSVTLNAANGETRSAGPITFFIQQKTVLSPKPPR